MVSAIEIMTSSLLRKLNLGVTSASRLEALESQSGSYFTLELLRHSPDSGGQLLRILPESRSQIQQDLFVLSQLG